LFIGSLCRVRLQHRFSQSNVPLAHMERISAMLNHGFSLLLGSVASALLALAAPLAAQHAVTTVAGGGSPDNVAALSAGLSNPAKMAIDSAGNLYFADSAYYDTNYNTFSWGNRVYKVSKAGILTTLAGTGVRGYSGDGGPAASAQLNLPAGVAVDPTTGNIYIADSGNGILREVDIKTGTIKTVYPTSGTFGDVDQVFIDASGHIFIVQTGMCDVIEVDLATQVATTVAGSSENCAYSGDGGLATAALLDNPTGISVDKNGNIFIADANRIREVVASSGKITTVAGNGGWGYTGDGGAATSAELCEPSGVWVDASGNLYIADTGNNVIRKVTSGKISTVAGNGFGEGTGSGGNSGNGGLAVKAELSQPEAVLVDGSQNILIADSSNHTIRKVVAASKDILAYAGNGHTSYSGDGGLAVHAQLSNPSGVYADSLGNLFIADQSNNAVREVVAATGKIVAIAGNGKQGHTGDGGLATAAELNQPYGVFADEYGNVFIADTGNNVIREVVAATGKIATVAGIGVAGYSGDGGLATAAQLNQPYGVFGDHAGNLFIADTYNNVIRKVAAANGKIATVVGNGTWGYSGDKGPATSAELWQPTAVFVDSSGNLFIVDTWNSVIREVTAANGKISTLGNGSSGIFVDGGGNLFFTTGWSSIMELNSKTQAISLVAGNYTTTGYLDSPTATKAEFDGPLGLTGDHAGNLYVADSLNNRIRKIATLQGTDESFIAPPPTFSPAPGVYPVAQTVTLKDAASGAAIHFTANGTTPTTSSTKYTTPLSISATTTLSAVATVSGDSLSPVSQATYTIATATPAPTFSPLPGAYIGVQTVMLTTNVTGATIHYTTNGTTPTAASAAYSKPISVSATTAIKAIAVASGFKSNTVGSGAYKIETQVAEPVFTPVPRGYWTAQSVKLADAISGAAIYYTLDGSTPTAKSTKYAGTAIAVSKATTIKAIAIVTGDVSSVVATGVYTFDNPTLVAERALAQQGIGIGLATQTFISQLSLAQNVLLGDSSGGDHCVDASSTLLSLTQAGHLGGLYGWHPASSGIPGYGAIFYDNNCTQPWAKADLYNWTESLDGQETSIGLTGATDESTTLYGLNGATLGTMQLTEAMGVDRRGDSEMAATYGLGSFAPKSGAPVAQLGLSCSVDVYGFLTEGTPALCTGGMEQDFPNLNLSLGFLLPISFNPVISPGVAWTGSQFVAVSADGAVRTSPTGAAWAAQTSGTANSLRSVASSGSELVAVGSTGTILTSKNGGASWTAQTSGTTASLASVVWTGSQFVAVGVKGLYGVILTSPNGTKWTTQNYGGPALLDVISSGKLLVAVGEYNFGSNLVNSTDGINWTINSSAASVAHALDLDGVASSGTQFVALGPNTDCSGGAVCATILTSPDGLTWNWSTGGVGNKLFGVTWSRDKKIFVAVGGEGTIATSPDGNTWTTRTSNTTNDLKSVAWSGKEFVAIGAGNVVVTSPDGVKWTVVNAFPNAGARIQFTSAGSTVVSGPLGGLKMTAPTLETLAVAGGTSYGTAAFKGYAGDMQIFIPTPTSWTATDTAHGLKFQIAESASRTFTGSITEISNGKTLSTFTLDRSGTGTITYSDGSKAAVTNWLPAN
jgi:sugar lactone lactonase YvrE